MDYMAGGYPSAEDKPSHVFRQTVPVFCKEGEAQEEEGEISAGEKKCTAVPDTDVTLSRGEYPRSHEGKQLRGEGGATLLSTPDGFAALTYPNGKSSRRILLLRLPII
jgi:hypothetical protein